jgi:hypothetical protein
MRMMRRSVPIALALGLALIGVAIVVVPTRSPLVVAATNAVPGKNYIELEEKRHELSTCQPAGTIPQGTTAIRLAIEGIYYSPGVTVKILRGSNVLAEGGQIAGGPAIPNVTVPVKRVAQAVQNARICTTVAPAVGVIRFYGTPKRTSSPPTNPLQQATLHIDYMRPGTKSWWSFASSIAKHMGLGHAPSGGEVVFLLLILMLALVAIAARLTLEELR